MKLLFLQRRWNEKRLFVIEFIFFRLMIYMEYEKNMPNQISP